MRNCLKVIYCRQLSPCLYRTICRSLAGNFQPVANLLVSTGCTNLGPCLMPEYTVQVPLPYASPLTATSEVAIIMMMMMIIKRGDVRYWRQRTAVNEATPFPSVFRCWIKKGRDRPLLRVSASCFLQCFALTLVVWWQEEHSSRNKPVPRISRRSLSEQVDEEENPRGNRLTQIQLEKTVVKRN